MSRVNAKFLALALLFATACMEGAEQDYSIYVEGDTIADMQRAIDHAKSIGGGVVRFCGTLKNTEEVPTVVIDSPGITIRGCGQKRAVLEFSTYGFDELIFFDVREDADNLLIENMTMSWTDE